MKLMQPSVTWFTPCWHWISSINLDSGWFSPKLNTTIVFRFPQNFHCLKAEQLMWRVFRSYFNDVEHFHCSEPGEFLNWIVNISQLNDNDKKNNNNKRKASWNRMVRWHIHDTEAPSRRSISTNPIPKRDSDGDLKQWPIGPDKVLFFDQ